jgi:hypothetical protein
MKVAQAGNRLVADQVDLVARNLLLVVFRCSCVQWIERQERGSLDEGAWSRMRREHLQLAMFAVKHDGVCRETL